MGKGLLPTILLIFYVLIVLVLMAGCVGTPVKTSGSTPSTDLTMERFDADLANGPVLVEFGASWCDWCVKEKPVIDNLTKEYPDVKFYSIDTDSDKDLANAFYVNGIPEMNVIAAKNADGTYLYIDPYGNTTMDRKKSGIIGYTEAGPLRQVLDAALEARK